MTHNDIAANGFSIFTNAIDSRTVERLKDTASTADFARSVRGKDVFGARNILEEPAIAGLANSAEVQSLAEAAIGERCEAVRGIFFDKTPGANWPVAWHQDLTVAVAGRGDAPGWINWSMKAGVIHVQPPQEILESMVTLRIHLDDCGADRGPLRVLPGTHRLGRLSADRIKSLRGELDEEVCCASSGSVLAMKPLLLHASSAAKSPSHRRVIHLEFAPLNPLPFGLQWAFRRRDDRDIA